MKDISRTKIAFLVSIAEWLVVLLLIYGVISLIGYTPSGGGPIGKLIGVENTGYFYGALYSTEAILIIITKVAKKFRALKVVLLATYLTNFFISVLQWSIHGWTLRFLDNSLVIILAAGAWLWYKISLDYMSVEEAKQVFDENLGT